jgi:dethiobiotin synthetase
VRPDRVIVVAGTGTDVGKTWVACAVIARLRSAGVTVVARKPAQSYSPPDAVAARTDAHLLGAASGEDPHTVTPPHRWYPVPLAPPMAADALGRPSFSIGDLTAELDAGWRRSCKLGIVETAGGLRSPVAHDGDSLAFAMAIGATDVVVVADAGLGTINNIRLAVAAVAATPLPHPIVVLNRFESTTAHDTHARNAAWLRDHDHLDVLTDMDELVATLASRVSPSG